MEEWKDTDILSRLIYMAYVAPERAHLNIGDVTFIPFRAALDLYARTWRCEESEMPLCAPGCAWNTPVPQNDIIIFGKNAANKRITVEPAQLKEE